MIIFKDFVSGKSMNVQCHLSTIPKPLVSLNYGGQRCVCVFCSFGSVRFCVWVLSCGFVDETGRSA